VKKKKKKKKKKTNNKGEIVPPDSPDCWLPEWHPTRDGKRTSVRIAAYTRLSRASWGRPSQSTESSLLRAAALQRRRSWETQANFYH